MSEAERLAAWMRENRWAYRSLSKELGCSESYIYKLSRRGDRKITWDFRMRFAQRFGWDAASQVFDLDPIPVVDSHLATV